MKHRFNFPGLKDFFIDDGENCNDEYNKASLKELQATLKRLDFNPLESLVKFAKDDKIDVSLRIDVNIALLQALYPKLQNVEHTGADRGPIKMEFYDMDD